MLALMAVAACFMVAQKRSIKEDSPARYGCRIWVQQVNGVMQQVDPNAGEGPPNNEENEPDPQGDVFRDIFNEVSDDVPSRPVNLPEPTAAKPLIATQYEVFKIGNQSVIGRPGDYVIEFKGNGFVASEGTPILHIGEAIVLEDSHVGADGKVLSVVLPADVAADLARRDLSEFAIQNPGGLERNPARWSKMPFVKATLLSRIQGAQTANFVQGAYFLERK